MPLTEFGDRFEPGSRLLVDGRAHTVLGSRAASGGGILLRLEGVADRSAAERYRGRYLEVPDSEVHELPPGAYYPHHLVGCAVLTEEGEELGVLVGVEEYPANDVWVVRTGSAQGPSELLVPAVRQAVVAVDLEARRVVVAGWVTRTEDAI